MKFYSGTRIKAAPTRVGAALLALMVALGVGVIFCFATSGVEKAYANELQTARYMKPNEIVSINARQQTAYDRAVKTCMDYKNQPNPIVIDVSDLGLTKQEALDVGEMIHGNGELFYINTYSDDSYGTSEFTLPCYYDDATIDSMCAKLDKVVDSALKRLGPKMTGPTKVHMLYDYVIDRVNYQAGKKDAYTGLVERKGDCFAYALSLDLLMRRAGFATDIVYHPSLDHAWNQVRIGKNWYNVDATFGKRFSYTKENEDPYFNWKNVKCHIYLLQSDSALSHDYIGPYAASIQRITGWKAHHACTSTKYDAYKVIGPKGTFSKHCDDYRTVVTSFTVNGIKYAPITGNRVKVASVTGATQRKAKSLVVPATVKYKDVTYYVIGIGSKAFSSAKATTLKVKTSKLQSKYLKNSLKKSKVTKVKLYGDAKKKKNTYKKYFAKSISGKKVTVS